MQGANEMKLDLEFELPMTYIRIFFLGTDWFKLKPLDKLNITSSLNMGLNIR